MKRLPVRVLAPIVVIAALLFYLPRLVLGDAVLPAFLPAARFDAVGSLAKLTSLAVGAIFGVRVALRIERDNPARRAWMRVGLWLACFAAGQAALMRHTVLRGVSPPLPSAADAFFLLGYALMLIAAGRFIRVYRASGFPVGSAGEHLTIAGVATVILVIVGALLLAPIARAPVALPERIINVAYPVLDLVALVPALVMLRITRAFRGGKIWAAWAALLVGFILMAGGDVLFAYFSSVGVTAFASAIDLMFVLGYFFAACGTMLQHEMLTE